MRAYASASIAFGMVSIPVRLYAAVEAAAHVSFCLLHKNCGSRLKQQYACAKEGSVVERADMVKGYEFAKDQYVTFTAEELEQLEAVADGTVAIAEFVKLASVDTIYFNRSYFVGPDKGADKAYRLLARAMRQAGQAAVARYAARGKDHLVLLIAVGDKLVMQELHYAAEVRSIDDVPAGPDVDVPAAELQLAKKVIRDMSSPKFRPEKYSDATKARLQERIDAKIEGREITIPPHKAMIIDLAEALKASIAKPKRKGAAAAGQEKVS